MSDLPSYPRRYFKRVLSETVVFTRNKLLIGAAMGILARIAGWEFSRTQIVHELIRDILIFTGSYITAVIGSFLINLIRVPALLDADSQKEIAHLSAEVELPDKAQADHLRGLIAKLDENGRVLLNLAVFHDELTYEIMEASGLSHEIIQKGTRNGLDSGLLHYGNNSSDPMSPLRWMSDFYWVSPEIRAPLKRLLHRP